MSYFASDLLYVIEYVSLPVGVTRSSSAAWLKAPVQPRAWAVTPPSAFSQARVSGPPFLRLYALLIYMRRIA